MILTFKENSMYYIVSDDQRYYAGKCCSDDRTLVWKNHYTRALGFDTMERALDFAKKENIFFLSIEYMLTWKYIIFWS